MEKKEIYRRQQVFEQELASYKGDDPLKLRYSFISWLDENYGKENVMDTFFPVLEDTLESFWNVAKYQHDSRFLQLLLTYVSMQSNPIDMYNSIYEKGIGSESPQFYTSWANACIEKEDYKRAEEVFDIGFTKTKCKSELQNSYEQLLILLGKKFLRFINSNNVESECPLCSCRSKNKERTPHFTLRNEDNQCWEFNPLKVGEKDDFQCPAIVPDPPDVTKKAMYCKHLVYDGEKEYSLEELRSRIFLKKLKEKEDSKETSSVMQHKGDFHKAQLKDVEDQGAMEVDNIKEGNGKELDQENALLQVQNELFSRRLLQQNPEFSKKSPVPPMSHDTLMVSQTSYTAHMKEAMNVVQEMWSSPTPAVSTTQGTGNRALCKSIAEPVGFINEKSTTTSSHKNTVPFSIYSEDCQPDIPVPTPEQCTAATDLRKNAKEKKEKNVLSELKPKRNFEGEKFNKQPTLCTNVKQQLPFSNVRLVEDNPQDQLAMKLGEVSLINNVDSQQTRITAVKPLLPPDQDDFSDVTCNTKAFNFPLSSSTPIQNKKISSSRNIPDSQRTVEGPQKLDKIVEASKEESSTNTGCTLREQPAVIQHSDAGSKQLAVEHQEIDPFCPKLLERLLNSINFPQDHHGENYFVFNSSLPSMGKTLKLGNETYNIGGDIGRGAYARILKATVHSRTCALKVEKPACKWEHYICREIKHRVNSSVKSWFMDVRNAYIFDGGSILESDWAHYGTLLNVSNQHKVATGKLLDSTLVLHFAIELIDIINFLHQCNIIHADIKPDNFVVKSLPSINETQSCLQLIDFGRSIDMRLFPPGTQFTTVVKTEGFTCCEMKERRPWTYQTDLYGLAATIYCLIVGEYMIVEKKDNEWRLHKQLPRSVRKLWEPVFSSLLNIKSSDKLPSLVVIKRVLEESLNSKDQFLLKQNFRSLENIFKGK